MNNRDAHVNAIELALMYLRNGDVYRDLAAAGLTPEAATAVYSAYCDIIDSLQTTKNLWERENE